MEELSPNRKTCFSIVALIIFTLAVIAGALIDASAGIGTVVPEKPDCPVLTKTADLHSAISDLDVVHRADLMENDMHLQYEENGDERYVLSWQESKGDWYELQEWSFRDQKWISRQVYQWSDLLCYDTGRLPSCKKMRFRVITYNDTLKRDREEFEAEPSEVTFRTKLSPLYCTVWPLTALDISEDISGNRVTGQAPAGKSLCVLEETEGRFLVRYEDKYGYIDSGYCLIDLAEYLGDLCKYNITNSYSSAFRVHGYDVPEVTGKVVRGYENIHMENGEMLVPYLYPCAQKLYQAALQAEEDGYVLCIYDAFRPNEASRYLYDRTEVILDRPVLNGITSEETEALELYEDNILTYREVMTDNRFHLGSFLAQTISAHNRGIALDLTMVSAALEEELEMQSDMHDLSWYSIPARNNRNADLLASYMEGVGYHGIASEWWHFQDDETRNQLNLGYLEMGVSPEGWKRDELGWKYRLADGSYYYADTVLIDNKECTFNEDGYLADE